MRFLSSTLKLFALSLFLLAFACSSLLAQGWYQTYPELYPSSEITTNGQQVSMFEGIIQTKDNGFLTWGSHIQNGVPTSNRAFRFTKTDLTGNVQWTQLYEEGVSPAFDGLTGFTMTALPNGNGYLGMGKTTNQTVSTFRGIQLDDQANVVNSFELSEFDLVGATITFGPTTTTKMIDIVPSPDGTFVAMFSNYAPYFAATADENYSWLAKINLDGSIVWTSMIANTIAVPSFGIEAGQTTLMMSGLDVSPSGEIYASGISSVPIITTYQVLFKYDINGNELWFQKRETPNSSSEFTDVLAHPTGDVIVRGHELGWSSVMARLSSAGDTIWADTNAIYFYTENSTEYIPIDFCVLKDGNIGVLEMQTDNVDSQDQNLRFVIKDIYNNYLSTGNPFLSSLYSYHVGNGINSGKSPNDFDLIATNDNSMALAGQYFYSDVADPSITPFTYDVAYPYLAKQGPGGEIPTVSLSGHLFIDSNNNCTFDVGEEGVAYKPVSSEYFTTLTDQNGYYEVNLALSGTYNVSSTFGQVYPYDFWTTTCADSWDVAVDANGSDIEGVDFGFVTLYDCPRLEVDLLVTTLRPGFTNNPAFISYQNTGTLSEDSVSVYMTMDSLFSITPGTSSIPYTFDAASNTYEFFIGTLEVFESGFLTFQITCPVDAVLGSTPCFEAFILPFDRCNLETDGWDESELRVSATCETDSVLFTIENIGEGDMEMSKNFAIYADELLIQMDDVLLNSGQANDIRKFATGETYRMMVEQSDNFPEPSFPSAVIEMCNASTEPPTLGLVANSPLDDQVHYRDIECTIVTGSYDPNDKRVVPSGITDQNYVNANVELEYTIRFQNTGTDTAFNVFILDTLSEFLDINTFNAGPASHDYELSLLPGRVIRWDFPNILLPDSTTNLIGSNGALKFTIRAVSEIPQPTEIHNIAGIYFDYNAPVITEDMFVTICDECLIQTLATEGVYFDGKVLLEGPYNGAGLMTNDLQDLIPMNQPFANFPYMYDGNEQLEQVPLNMVDWVLVEARSGTPATNGDRATTTVETKAAILLNDGSIRGLDGIEGVRFVNLTSDESYHFCIRHRNHLDILTATALFPTENMVYDFTTGTSQALGAAQMKWFGADAKAVMYSGDFNSDGVIQTTDYDIWSTQPAAVEVYDFPDANLDGVIQVSDYDKWFFNKAKVGNVEIGF